MEIGQFYRVPTVKGRWYEKVRDWPVIGPKHEDREIVSFDQLHYHIDGRFVSKQDFDSATAMRSGSYLLGIPLCEGFHSPNPAPMPKPVMRRRKLHREFSPYPKAKWLPELETAYAHVTLKSAVCPHKGIPLDGLAQDENGVVTCPAHGLRWNFHTGALVPAGAKP